MTTPVIIFTPAPCKQPEVSPGHGRMSWRHLAAPCGDNLHWTPGHSPSLGLAHRNAGQEVCPALFSPVVIDSSVHSSVYRNESGNVLINYNSPLAVSRLGSARQHETLQISIGNVGRTDGDVCMETMTTHWQEVVLTPHSSHLA